MRRAVILATLLATAACTTPDRTAAHTEACTAQSVRLRSIGTRPPDTPAGRAMSARADSITEETRLRCIEGRLASDTETADRQRRLDEIWARNGGRRTLEWWQLNCAGRAVCY